MIPKRLLCIVFLFGLSFAQGMQAAETFTINLGSNEDAKKIGDLKPKFIAYDRKTPPEASIEYVMKRYRALFESAQTPEIKIDALNRLNNLGASFGVKQKDLNVDPYVQNEVILSTYQKIIDTGAEYQKMDELLYQTAKATAFAGDILESIRRLELLVALYPDSSLMEEALFRLAENYFDLAVFDKALKYYQQLARRKPAKNLKMFTDYKLAWTQYRLEHDLKALGSIAKIAKLFPELTKAGMTSDYASFEFKGAQQRRLDLPKPSSVLQDSARLLAIIVDAAQGAPNIQEAAASIGGASYESFVLRSLNEHYHKKKRYYESAQLTEGYVYARAANEELLDFAGYAIQSYKEGDHLVDAWTSKAKLVEHFGLRSDFWAQANLETRERLLTTVSDTTKELAHLNFVRMQQQKSKTQLQIRYARQAASYYLQLATLWPDSTNTGEYVYLAAQALEAGGRDEQAIQMYERAGYEEQTSPNKKASAYAALLLYAKKDRALEASWSVPHEESTMRFLAAYPDHVQAGAVALRAASELVSRQLVDEALAILVEYDKYVMSSGAERYDAAKLKSDLYYNTRRYGMALIGYRQALSIQNKLPEKSDRVGKISELNTLIGNTTYQIALTEQDPEKKVQLFLSLEQELPNHELASAAIYDAASVDIAQENWLRASQLLEVFSERYTASPLVGEARAKLIYVYEQSGDQLGAAEQLMSQAQSSDDVKLAHNSAYKAAQHYQDLRLFNDAADSYRWLIDKPGLELGLKTEALYFFVAFSEQLSGVDKLTEADAFLQHLESEDLDDARSATLGAEVALVLANNERQNFEAIKLDLPFRASLSRKSDQLRRTTLAYERVLSFEIEEYLSAARYNMAYSYQTLAHDIMNSEQPKGLNELELEQYQILLEEQAIPVEEQAIALHKLNVTKRKRGQVDPYIQKSYQALAILNPSLYQRPIKESSHAPTIY
jgi:tetratricopeptide (TPR) repeat protein